MAGELSVCVPRPDVHTELRVIRLPSIVVKLSNLTKFEVPYSVCLKNGEVGEGRMLNYFRNR